MAARRSSSAAEKEKPFSLTEEGIVGISAVGLKLHFAEPSLSTDNAVGVAMLAAYLSEKRNEACETNG